MRLSAERRGGGKVGCAGGNLGEGWCWIGVICAFRGDFSSPGGVVYKIGEVVAIWFVGTEDFIVRARVFLVRSGVGAVVDGGILTGGLN